MKLLYICISLVGSCILMLLQNDFLPEPEQRLAALTIFYDLYRTEPFVNNPFSNVFMKLLVSSTHAHKWFYDNINKNFTFSILMSNKVQWEPQNLSLLGSCPV